MLATVKDVGGKWMHIWGSQEVSDPTTGVPEHPTILLQCPWRRAEPGCLHLLSGMGDMAVSNSIGSNIFDILLGLGFPWALRTLIVDHGSVVGSRSEPSLRLIQGTN